MACLEHEDMKRFSLINKQSHQRDLRGGNEKDTKKDKKYLPDLPEGRCVPGKLYHKECQKCYCDINGKPLCNPSKPTKCKEPPKIMDVTTPMDVSPPITNKEFSQLPILPHSAVKCQSGKIYLIDCNTCLCLDNGNLLCETLLCLNKDEENAVKAKKWSGIKCKNADDALSDRCIRCDCKNNITECRAVPGCAMPAKMKLHGNTKMRLNLDIKKEKYEPIILRTNKLETKTLSCQPNITYVNGLEASNRHLEKLILGKYSFSVCGDMFLKDTIDLIPFTGKLLRVGAKNFQSNNTLEIKYAPAPVPPEYNEVQNEETMNAQRMYVDRSSDSNSIESEDDDANLSSLNTGTRMPELDRIASEEHVNIHKQKSDENSEVATPVRKKPKKVITSKFEIKAEVPSKVGLRNQDNKSDETYYREINLSEIFKKFLGLRKSPSRRAVSLDSRSACKPGSEIAKDCNMCYCMRNGNLLCTKKLC
ncbi:hypothetical protein RR46_07952 [Papilio xuthus]|uniref:Pacifastin domain-containing protein n=1 Tax=Papilio xuthus TaxID=66420 RepID=A0A194QF71_PAPXU|nr:hypothetical protein RR46_07952 [Papilio xuthus]